MSKYNAGGVIPGGPVVVQVSLDECFIRPDNDGAWHCHRELHVVHPELCQERRRER